MSRSQCHSFTPATVYLFSFLLLSRIFARALTDRSPASRGVPVARVPIVLSYVRDGVWTDFAKVITAQDGTFTQEWTPPAAGLYKVVARFEGSNSYDWSSGEATVRVKPAPPSPYTSVET